MPNKVQLWPTCWYVKISENKFPRLIKHHHLYFTTPRKFCYRYSRLGKIKSVYINDYELVMVFLDIKFCENNSFLQDFLESKTLWKVCHVQYIICGTIFEKYVSSIFSIFLEWTYLVQTFKLQVHIDMKHKTSRIFFFKLVHWDLYVQNLLISLRECNLTTRLLTYIKMSLNWFKNSLKFFLLKFIKNEWGYCNIF